MLFISFIYSSVYLLRWFGKCGENGKPSSAAMSRRNCCCPGEEVLLGDGHKKQEDGGNQKEANPFSLLYPCGLSWPLCWRNLTAQAKSGWQSPVPSITKRTKLKLTHILICFSLLYFSLTVPRPNLIWPQGGKPNQQICLGEPFRLKSINSEK